MLEEATGMARLEVFSAKQGAPLVATTQASGVVTAQPQPHRLYDASKRLLDVTLSLALLVLALPVLLVAAAAIITTTRRSPLFLQVRTGRLGREFHMLKLRTMRESMPAAALGAGLRAPKVPGDVRVTPVGRLLRRTSVDELPQLINVLRGEMSLVGPRPALPEEVALYPRSWQRALAVKPGITGLWQVSGRSELSPRQRTVLDRAYVGRRSLAFDCAILARTIRATLSMRGAW